jgi:hypothetical protein
MIAGTSPELDATLAFHEGDTWTGIPLFSVTPVPATDISLVEMVFLTDDDARREACRITSAIAAQIAITPQTSPRIWRFVVPAQKLPLTQGKYVWAIHITDSVTPAANRQHYAEGNILVKPKRRRVPTLPT